MNKLLLITSKQNKYVDQINKIIKESLFESRLTFKEDNFNCEDYIIYLFTKLDEVNENVINYKFYQNYKSKLEVQQLLKNNNISTPKIVDKITSYVYLKENKHEGSVKLINNYDQINVSDFYLEENIKGVENKYYFVFDKLFDKNIEIIDKNLINLASNIKDTLLLEVFSFDVISKENINYVIDVNIAPGFYKSDIARSYFINSIKDIKR